eukprot:gnl/TRDRNA2_/TRDRNA2_200681_c0_seq1.p1 gnl/TRDRNA2_/TRDRNA2_200681_c0~~gnl/TRDRNA2_/TRDRNA2_200681_c0_seq1.p1  ORF type:complete len:353 (+),score=44.03 gnl/TRDRNA2_/TRDRNA2_200681_c0_seq1:128-1060(+)
MDETAPTKIGGSSPVGWQALLNHFLASLRASSEEELDVHVLRFNASSPMRRTGVGAYIQLNDTSPFAYGVNEIANQMSTERFLAWHISMLFKAESWARVAGAHTNAGLTVLCADVDHTFFPGWRRVIEDCLEQHDICFEANWKETGTQAEVAVQMGSLPMHSPSLSSGFWQQAWVNTGLFAMRCDQTAAKFWTRVAGAMRKALEFHGSANDQTAANQWLQNVRINWGILDPYAVNQLSPWTLDSWWFPKRRRLGDRALRMLDSMVVHHAAYLGSGCRQNQSPAECKLWLMRLVNTTWWAHRSAGMIGSDG